MKVLVIGGMHGNEPLGQDIVRLFKQSPSANVTVVLANKSAIKRNVRFVRSDLNRSFPGVKGSKNYEERRAYDLRAICGRFDLVLDFHNTHCPNNDCSFVGESATRQLYGVSLKLGLKKVIVADYDCLNKYAPNCISIEISLSSKRMDSAWWCEKIRQLTEVEIKSLSGDSTVETYKFVCRMTLEDRDRLSLTSQNLQAFEPLERSLCKKLGVDYPAYPIFINDAYTPYNFGGLLSKLNNNNV